MGEYLNGNTKVIGIKNRSVEEINDFIMDLRNQIGKKVLQRKYEIEVDATKAVNIEGKPSNSIQGEWNEHVSLLDLEFDIEHVYAAAAPQTEEKA